MRESPWLREIRTLDPERDCRRIVFLDTFLEFPFDTTRALELAFFKTFAVPSIAELLDSTGEFGERGQKRYDDTDLLISAFAEDGWDGALGTRAIRRMNQIHSRFAISNDDYLYVLSAMVLEPIRWNERFGWRRMVEAERLAAFHCWREIGRRMAITRIPDSYEELERFNVEYERENVATTDATRRVGRHGRELFTAWFPRPLRPFVRRGIHVLLDEELRRAFGFPEPPPGLTVAAAQALQLRARVVRLLPPRRGPRLRTRLRRRRSYPRGYMLEELGPASSSRRRAA